MQKIPSLYVRDPETRAFVTREVHERCQWVIAGEGTATVKWDGTCVRLDEDGQWWTRHQVKPGKAVPPRYVPVEHDPVTGRTQGWIPAETSGYRAFLDEAIGNAGGYEWVPGTYELIGPKIGGNPHGYPEHELVPHGVTSLPDVPTEYDALASWLRAMNDGDEFAPGGIYLEGVVWHHPDGRMAKIKTKDFRVTADA
jgi:hypothetical protein